MRLTLPLAAVTACAQLGYALNLDVSSPDSIRSAASTLAHGLMNYYQNNKTDTPKEAIGTLPYPLYWWEAGAVWGGLVDYWAYTQDTSFNGVVTQALLAQTGTDNNFMPKAYYSSMGEDDIEFWIFAVLSAIEYGFPDPPEGSPSWQLLAENAFNSIATRWDTSTCNGGLRWQVFASNAGYNYKNSVSNGGFFQVAARLARFTGNSTYYDWAERVWDWTVATALIDDSYRVFDGASVTDNCATVQKLQWTYNSGIYIYGAAMLYNYTNASSVWETRLTGLVEQADQSFFQAYANASGILVEGACEPYGTCNNDMFSFKAYISRFMAKAMVVAPYTTSTIEPLLVSSAQGAAKSCSGPSDGVTCGQKWYVDGFDGSYGVGQQLSALEVTQALLINEAPGLIDHNNIKIRPAPTSSSLVSTVSIGAASVSGISGTSIEPSATTTATATASTIATTSATTFAQESDTTSATESGATSSFTSAMLSASSSALSSAASSAASSASSSAALSTASSGTMSLPTSSAPAKTTSTATATTSANPTSTKNAAAKNTGIARVGALVGGVWIGAAVLL